MSSIPGKQGTTSKENIVGRSLRDGEYYIQGMLGHGGMGKVYLASHTELTAPLALKQARADQPLPESTVTELDSLLTRKYTTYRFCGEQTQTQEYDFPSSEGTHTDRFLREALLLARLHHPSIPTLYDYFFEDGYWYLVMDYVPGTTLSAYLQRHAPLAALEALNYTMQLCDVLDYLHRQTPPIIFRDLKPSNIILMPDGTLMLVDFGIARYFKEGQVNDTTDFGSPGYASPEQYQGAAQTDGRSDLFSMGVILREMITGQHPIGLGTPLASPQYINTDISVILSGLITLATRLEPIYRFQSAHAFYLALERAYAIEERRLYQRHIHKARGTIVEDVGEEGNIGKIEKAEVKQGISSHGILVEEMSIPGIPDHIMAAAQRLPCRLEQRYQNRELIQQARRQRQAEENLEIQLASVDESLKRRSLLPLAPTPLLPEEEPEYNSIVQRRSPYKFHRTIQAKFQQMRQARRISGKYCLLCHQQRQIIR
jgi:serine/threonine protein kinase